MEAVATLISLSFLDAIVLVESSKDKRQGHHNIPKEACDSMLVSHAGATEGKVFSVQHITFQIFLLQTLVEVQLPFKILENCLKQKKVTISSI